MIISIAGGLGNQMFQYAYLLSQKERYPQGDITGLIVIWDILKLNRHWDIS